MKLIKHYSKLCALGLAGIAILDLSGCAQITAGITKLLIPVPKPQIRHKHQDNFAVQNVSLAGRYSTINNAPNQSQIDPLETVLKIIFPPTVVTVRDALNSLLKYSGYVLAPKQNMSQALLQTLSRPLPLTDRSLGPITLKQALLTLVGAQVYELEVNRVGRLINFKLISTSQVPKTQPLASS